jgi:hypothetical protein
MPASGMLKRRLGARAFLGERAVAVRGLTGVRSRNLQHVVARARGAPARQLADRLRALLAALDHPGAADLRSLARSTEDALAEADASKVWLALAVLTGRLPLDDDVVATARRGAGTGRRVGHVAALNRPVSPGTGRGRAPGRGRRPAPHE